VTGLNLDEWAQGVQREVFEFWKQQHSDHEQGVKIFYSPIKENPNTLFLGFNPGGSSFGLYDVFSNGDFSLPSEHEYLTEDYKLARKMRNKIFPDNPDLLLDSVALNYIYFRTQNSDIWDNIDQEMRSDMKSFCREKTQQIINKLQPDNIVVFGIRTWDEMQSIYGFETAETYHRHSQSDQRLLCISEQKEPQFAGFCHPSSQFSPSNNEFKELRERLVPLLEE
jgi:hypothetical protein